MLGGLNSSPTATSPDVVIALGFWFATLWLIKSASVSCVATDGTNNQVAQQEIWGGGLCSMGSWKGPAKCLGGALLKFLSALLTPLLPAAPATHLGM